MTRSRSLFRVLFAVLSLSISLPTMAPEVNAAEPEPLVVPSGSGDITVRITGLRNTDGTLSLALFDAKKGFPGKFDRAVRTLSIPASEPERVAVFDKVPWGRYAVAVRHDENGNGKLDSNFLGMPKEGVGTSNNPKSSFGPPLFDDAAFMLEQRELELNVKLKYL